MTRTADFMTLICYLLHRAAVAVHDSLSTGCEESCFPRKPGEIELQRYSKWEGPLIYSSNKSYNMFDFEHFINLLPGLEATRQLSQCSGSAVEVLLRI